MYRAILIGVLPDTAATVQENCEFDAKLYNKHKFIHIILCKQRAATHSPHQ